MKTVSVLVIGGGLAGCEAALQLAEAGFEVNLMDGKPHHKTAAHVSPYLAELVCSNSFKAIRRESAAGLLKHELSALGCSLLKIANEHTVPAGGALAVDAPMFAKGVTEAIEAHPLITRTESWLTQLPRQQLNQYIVLSAGPLMGEELANDFSDLIGDDFLKFFDAVAPVVLTDTLDMESCFLASRYGRGEADYWNCPLDQNTYEEFVALLASAPETPIQDFEKQLVFEGCMPLEVMAKRGKDTLRFGPLKPVGLIDPKTGKRPYACLQLRQANQAKTMAHLVGCQTRINHTDQLKLFRLIPALRNATFSSLGVMHRNTYVSAPRVLNWDLSLKARSDIFVAGQLNGMEGYVAAIASGWFTAQAIIALSNDIETQAWLPHAPTMFGAMVDHLHNQDSEHCQPFAASFGLLPEPENSGVAKLKKAMKREWQLEQAEIALQQLLERRQSFDEVLG